MSRLKKISKILAIDFETANRTRASACSLGLCVINFESGEITEKRQFLINPETTFDYFNSLINGITPQMVQDAPIFSDILPEIESRLDDQTIVVAHNASFDISVLRKSCEKANKPVPDLNYYCTYLLARALMPGMTSYSLDSVAEKCGIPSFRHHLADDDAEACALIFLHLIRLCDAVTIEQLARRSGIRFGYVVDNHYYAPCRMTSSPKVDIEYQSDIDAFSLMDDELSEIDEASPFFEKVVVFTGALSGMPRAEAEKNITSVGGIVRHSVTKKTNYVVCGYQDLSVLKGKEKSSKLLAAEELATQGYDIQILPEDDFFKML